jgi:hypothetical protein
MALVFLSIEILVCPFRNRFRIDGVLDFEANTLIRERWIDRFKPTAEEVVDEQRRGG